MAPVIEARGLTKRYATVVAVDELDLHITAGEIYGLLGLNGAGKTTPIRMLLGMVRPTSGTVHVLGAPVGPGAQAAWSKVGYLLETPAAYPELTVRENLAVAARLRALRGSHHVDEVIERLKLTAYADQSARTLSLGNAQRLGLAKALLHQPDLLVLDEPANGLDPAGVAEIRDLLRELSQEHGVTVVLSSHILTEVARLATRIGVIHHGRLVRELQASDLTAHLRQRLSVSARDLDAATFALTAAGFIPIRSDVGDLVLSDCSGGVVINALATEVLKARRSRVPTVTAVAFTVAAAVGGLFMFILQNQDRARSLGLIGTKAALVGGEADWPTYFSFLAQTTAVGGMLVVGLVSVWLFGREFSQNAVKDLLALPTSRTAIVAAKFVVALAWCVILAVQLVLLGLLIGTVLGLPDWSGEVAASGVAMIAATAVMTMLLTTPIALRSSVGRGYLPGVGVMMTAVFCAQVVAALGYGQYFPRSVPALFSGLAGPDQVSAGLFGVLLVVLVGAAGVAATALWWRNTDHDR